MLIIPQLKKKRIARNSVKEMTGVEEDFLLDIVMLRLSQVKNLVRTALLWKETATDSNPPLSTYMHKRPR